MFVGYGPDEGKYVFNVVPCYKGQEDIDVSKGESTYIEHNEYFERFIYDGNRPYDHTLAMNAIDATHSLTVTAIFGQVNFIVNYYRENNQLTPFMTTSGDLEINKSVYVFERTNQIAYFYDGNSDTERNIKLSIDSTKWEIQSMPVFCGSNTSLGDLRKGDGIFISASKNNGSNDIIVNIYLKEIKKPAKCSVTINFEYMRANGDKEASQSSFTITDVAKGSKITLKITQVTNKALSDYTWTTGDRPKGQHKKYLWKLEYTDVNGKTKSTADGKYMDSDGNEQKVQLRNYIGVIDTDKSTPTKNVYFAICEMTSFDGKTPGVDVESTKEINGDTTITIEFFKPYEEVNNWNPA